MTEQEIDVRRYWSAITARWWLPVLGLIAGAAIGVRGVARRRRRLAR